jgi:hypothetical protein
VVAQAQPCLPRSKSRPGQRGRVNPGRAQPIAQAVVQLDHGDTGSRGRKVRRRPGAAKGAANRRNGGPVCGRLAAGRPANAWSIPVCADMLGRASGALNWQERPSRGEMTGTRLDLTRPQILAFRRCAGALDARLERGPGSLRRAAWAGLQDSMPRAALLSIHARVAGTEPSTWEDPSLVQLWGPRFSVFVVAARDLAPFSLGRLPDDTRGRQRAQDLAARLHALLGGARMTYGDAGLALGVHPNSLRYAAATGTVLIRWEGARQSAVWTVPPPDVGPAAARLELSRRYLHVYGPATPEAFGQWAGIGGRAGAAAFEALRGSLTPVRTPVGDAWILTEDEAAVRAAPGPAAPARLLPSGDAYFLLQGADRDLLVPDAGRRRALWTPRVWPGALLVGGEIAGTWRRADAVMTVQPWRRLSPAERDAVGAEAQSLPLPGLGGRITLRWDD